MRSGRLILIGIDTESVEPIVYFPGGSGKTLERINNTPHLYISSGVDRKEIPSDECDCLSTFDLKFTRFPEKDKSKTPSSIMSVPLSELFTVQI